MALMTDIQFFRVKSLKTKNPRVKCLDKNKGILMKNREINEVEAEAIDIGFNFKSPISISILHLEWRDLFVTLVSGGDKMAVTV